MASITGTQKNDHVEHEHNFGSRARAHESAPNATDVIATADLAAEQ